MSALAVAPIAPLAQSGPVIPNFGRGDDCIRNNGKFCLRLVPRQLRARASCRGSASTSKMTAIAVVHRLRHRLHRGADRAPLPRASSCRSRTSRRSSTRSPRSRSSRSWCRSPGIGWTSIEIALVSYTLLILFRNILTGLREVPGRGQGGGRGHGPDPAPDAQAGRAAARRAGDHRRPAGGDRHDDLARDRRRVHHAARARRADLQRDPERVRTPSSSRRACWRSCSRCSPTC